jgi:hypothetical protein
VIRLDHSELACVLWSPGPDDGTWCGCLFIVFRAEAPAVELAATRDIDAARAAELLLLGKNERDLKATSVGGAW